MPRHMQSRLTEPACWSQDGFCHCCGKGEGELLCCSLLGSEEFRYQMARLPPTLIPVETKSKRAVRVLWSSLYLRREEHLSGGEFRILVHCHAISEVRLPGSLLGLGVVHAGISPADFSPWEWRHGEVCVAQQKIDLFEWIRDACEDSAVSVWAPFIRLGDILKGPNVWQCWVWVPWQWGKDGVYSLEKTVFSFNGLNSFWVHLSIRPPYTSEKSSLSSVLPEFLWPRGHYSYTFTLWASVRLASG